MRSIAFAWFAAAVFATTLADAQTLPSIDARTWRPSTDPNASLVLEPIATPGAWNWNAGAWLNYALRPITLRNASDGSVAYRPVSTFVGADVTASLGLGERAAVGVAIPTVLYQDGTGDLPGTISATGQVPNSALGDIAITGKGTIISNVKEDLAGGFGLAAIAAVTLPTGDRASFLGEGSTTASLRFLAEYNLLIANVSASVGYRARTAQRTWPDASVGGVTFGDEIPWSIGATFRPFGPLQSIDKESRQTWELAAHGWLPAGPVAPFATNASRLSPAMLAISDRIALGHWKDSYVVLGADVGLNTAVGVPAIRAIAAIGWAPREHDKDHDGVPDGEDQCDDLAEDRDGIDDNDGCPEDDADDDGIPDHLDACPHAAGVWWNDRKKNGCPAKDSDNDSVPDHFDVCPTVPGTPSEDARKNGCPEAPKDRDGDGVPDDKDKCPDMAGPVDGCPEPDSDGDGILDKDDACPHEKGEKSDDPKKNGCPNPDRDGDTYLNDADKCPDEAEVFNGVDDEDGCPDTGGKPLVTIDASSAKLPITLAKPIKLVGKPEAPEIDRASVTTLRAIVLELNHHRGEWTLFIGAKPGPGKPDKAQREAVDRAAAISKMIDDLALREEASEAVGWDAVKQQPNAASGIGLMIVVTPKQEAKP
jgi:hypothetical protein